MSESTELLRPCMKQARVDDVLVIEIEHRTINTGSYAVLQGLLDAISVLRSDPQ